MQVVYAYGIECTLSTAIILALLAIGGIVLHKFAAVCLFVLAWLPLRMLVGGAHANTHFMCTVVSVGLDLGSVAVSDYIDMLPLAAVIAIMMISYIIIFLLAPVIHKNHPVSEQRKKKMRGIARLLGAIECLIIVVLKMTSASSFAGGDN